MEAIKMTNGHDFPPDYIIGICPYCKKQLKNKDRFFEEKRGKYVHYLCSTIPSKKDKEEFKLIKKVK